MKRLLLTQNKYTIMDKEDFEIFNNFKWYLTKQGYAARGHSILLHREIMKAKKDFVIDHINGDKLDNRRNNLRICTQANNISHRIKLNKNNSSGYIGVTWHSQRGKWRARIMVGRKEISLGLFLDIKEAIKIRNKAAVKYFGEFAYLNKI